MWLLRRGLWLSEACEKFSRPQAVLSWRWEAVWELSI